MEKELISDKPGSLNISGAGNNKVFSRGGIVSKQCAEHIKYL